MSRILITGAGGLLGQRFAPLCKQRLSNANIFAVFHHPHENDANSDSNIAVGDLTDVRFITDLIAHIRPDVIINLAALTNVEQCETDAALAQMVNVDIVKKLIELAPEARFVQLSTDYVFDGAKGMYTPDDTPAPLSLYGQTKYEAEQVVLLGENNLIVRTSGTYDWPGRDNLFTFFYNRLKAGKETFALTGAYYTPIWANDLAEGLLGLLIAGNTGSDDIRQNRRSGSEVRQPPDGETRTVGDSEESGFLFAKANAGTRPTKSGTNHIASSTGIVHYAGRERMTRYEFALALARHFGFDEALLRPVMQEKFNWKARRPVDSSLDSSSGYVAAKVRPHSLGENLRSFGGQGGASPSTTLES